MLAQFRREVERAQYQAQRAERRYRAVDPENRLVARRLETEWQNSLRQLEAAVNRSVVANEKFATFYPDGRARMLGLAPKLPITITLLNDMTTNLLVRLRPLPVIGQGVLRFAFITAQLFSARTSQN